jgi:GNAT superfamily N-acetyltransferase
MDARYAIVEARPQDVAALPAIERAAARLLVGHVPDSMLEETTEESELDAARAAGRLWVALHGERVVGFALVEILESGGPHLEEIDVHPDHGRRGIGSGLVRAVCAWTAASGHREITLTTFRQLPWNMPFYARLGFLEVPSDRLTPELVAIVCDEAARGLDPARRVVMRYRCPPPARGVPPGGSAARG